MTFPKHGLIAIFLTLLLDQVTKWGSFAYLNSLETQNLSVTSFFNLVKVYNTGVSFGMLQDVAYGPILLSIFALLITSILILWMLKTPYTWLSSAFGLIIGGALGNVIDRLRFGAVIDFLDFHIAGYHWPAFNVADSAILLGVAMVLIDSFIFEPKRHAKPQPKD